MPDFDAAAVLGREVPEQQAEAKKSCCADKAEQAMTTQQLAPAPQEAPAAASVPSLPAVFEFGGYA